jgi:hypothetical protein
MIETQPLSLSRPICSRRRMVASRCVCKSGRRFAASSSSYGRRRWARHGVSRIAGPYENPIRAR